VPILPLPQFEADLALFLKEKEDREAYERLHAPTSIVVRFGLMKMVGEFPYDGSAKPGCGSRMVVRTHRGEELAEMLTSTCPNAGCSKSVTRREMLRYIENSGGRDYPFFDARLEGGTRGRVLRVATVEDLERQNAIDAGRRGLVARAREIAERIGFPAKIVEAEPLLGGGFFAYYYLAEQRIDHGPMLSALRELHPAERVELRSVGARDEARLTADYERCGQHCCCKSFLKVLKPVSMRSAKVQKATLDPLKISGRCGRLMCCLRYEDQTYKDLKKNLPHRKTRVGTPEGDGTVLDSQILTQLVLVELDTGTRVAVPVEELTEPGLTEPPHTSPPPRAEPSAAPERRERRQPAPRPASTPRDVPEPMDEPDTTGAEPDPGVEADAQTPPSRRSRRRRPRGDGAAPAVPTDTSSAQPAGDGPARPIGRRRDNAGPPSPTPPETTRGRPDPDPDGGGETDQPRPSRRRRRRRGGSGGGPSDNANNPSPDSSPGPA
jgi:cell fate regulator YaaT (PSP1 superfamily)